MCCPKSPLLADGDTEFDLRVRGLLLRLAGEGKTGICPRTPSIVSRTCKPKPAGRAPGNSIREPVHTRTVSPSVHPRSASGGATNFFPASALVPPPGLATERQRRHAIRPTDVCHPYELRAPAPRAFSARSRHFRGGDTPRSLGLRDVRLRDRVFHDTRDRFGGSSSGTNPALYCLTAWSHERGRCLPTVPMRSSL
jgi:hypothetical protein